jgi:hypothetical protein
MVKKNRTAIIGIDPNTSLAVRENAGRAMLPAIAKAVVDQTVSRRSIKGEHLSPKN